MQALEKEYELEFDPEELKQMSRILAETLLEQVQSEDNEAQFTLITCVSGYEIIKEDQITEVVNLDLIASSTASVLDPLGQLKEWFTSIINSIASWIISGITSFIDTYVTPTIDIISGNVSAIISTLANVPSLVVSAITQEFPALVSDITSSVVSTIDTVVLDPIRSFVDWVSAQFESLTPIADAIMAGLTNTLNFIDTLSAGLQSAFTNLTSQISSTLSSLASSITTTFTDLATTITTTFDSLMSSLTASVASLSDTIMSSLSAISTTISDLAVSVTATFDSLISNLASSVTSLSETIIASLSAIPNTISNMVDSIVTTLMAIPDAISNMVDSITASLMEILTAIETILTPLGEMQRAVSEFADLLINLPAKAPEIVYSIASAIWQQQIAPLFKTIDVTIIEPLKASINDIIVEVSTGFQQTSQVIAGFTNSILHFPEWFPIWFEEKISKPIVDAITPIQVKIPDEWLPQVSSTPLYAKIIFPPRFGIPTTPLFPMLTNPTAWITTSLQPIIEDATSSLWAGAQTIWNTILKEFGELLKTLWQGIKDISKATGEVLRDAFQGAWEIFKEVGEPFQEFIQEVYKPIPENTASQLEIITTPIFKDAFKEFEIGTPQFLTIEYVSKQLISATTYSIAMGFMPLWGQLPIRLTSWTLKALAKWISDHDWKIRINLRPLGIGVDTEFSWAKALGATLTSYSNDLMKWLDEIGRGMVYGYAIWMTQPIAKLLNFWFRNFIPVQLPREDIVIEFARRSMQYTYVRDATGKITEIKPSEFFSSILNMARYYYGLYGYSDEALRWIFSYSLEDWVQTKDRFGYIRNFPMSLMHELPSASDMATMMVRDLFYDIDSFKKVAHMRGMTEDIAYMYYFLRFRYPPPERLWQFVTRGISGLLWATLTSDELDEISKEAEAVGAPTPISPIELNKMDTPTCAKLLEAFKKYMKWHDYARFSWITEFPFTSDNLIYIDTLADIPTKIDQRWITKWGLYELLSNKGVGLYSPVSEFRTKIIENQAKSNITMDLTLFARTLQATGMHPDWIPITATAEAINALTDERTLLRTGFINLFKEGFWNVESLEKLLAGVIMASFKVSYFDMAEMKWGTGWINHPVMFLPAERKLLELRALMDRSLDILRDIARDVARGYSEWIIDDYNEYKNTLTKVIDEINKYFAEDYEAITGATLPDDLKLQFVESYYKPYIKGLDVYRKVFTIRRIRYWTQRWLGWVMYRVGTGVVKKEDIQEFSTYVAKYAKLTPDEKQFIQGVLERLMGIALREYIPTPSQLATLSEYLVISKEMINKVFEARRVPEEWRAIWQRYIAVRPIKTDFKSLLTVARRALRYGAITEDTWKELLSEALAYGFTQTEIGILERIAELEETIEMFRENRREYIPTPYSLATICEYIPKAREFFDEVMKARHVPKEWQPIWAEYIDLRPIISEVRKMVSRAEDLYTYFCITKEDYMKIQEEVKKFGYTDKEIELMLTSSEYERQRRAWQETIGSVSLMMTLAEYSPKAKDFALGTINKMIDALPIDDETKNTLKEMWKQYIRVRPVYSEVKMYITQLINLYIEGLISELDFTRELESLKEWGLSDDEIMFYKAIAGARKARKLKIPVYFTS